MNSKRPNPPDRHHFVPEFLVRGFSDPEGKVFAFRNGRGFFTSSPGGSFFERGWHTQLLADGRRDVSVERRLDRDLESAAAHIVAKIVGAADRDALPALTMQERNHWDAFFVCQRIRTPDHHRALGLYEEFDKRVEEWLSERAKQGRIVPKDLANRLRSTKNVDRLRQSVRIQSYVRPLSAAMAVLRSRGIVVLKALSGCEPFVVGSYPVIKLCPPDTNDLRDERVEMWLPVSSTVAVGTGGAFGTETIVGMLDSGHTSSINDAIARQSSTIAGSSNTLLEKVVSRADGRIGTFVPRMRGRAAFG